MATKWERQNTWKSSVEWKSGSTYVDPSSNMSHIKVYKSDGTLYISESGARSDTGRYHYYVSTQSTDPLGYWIIDWYAYFNYGNPWNWMPKHEREIIQLVDTEIS